MSDIVSPQITDSVTQTNTKVLGEVPAFATGNLMQVASQSAGLAMQNAVTNQQQSSMIHQASTTQGINLIYSVDTAAAAQATDTVNRSNTDSKITDALALINSFKG